MKKEFQTEVSQLLDLMIHSLYSHKEIFLRELVSNASDALDKLKFLTVSDDKFKDFKFDPKIEISFDDKDRKWLKISDTGVGMSEEDLNENLGTIAKSGTKNFLSQMTGDKAKDSNLIGKFGVGFYSAFMVADTIEVITKKAGEDKAYKWTSDGKNGYDVEPCEKEANGTEVTLYLSEDGKEYANRWSLDSAIKKYSNHIPFQIFLHFTEKEHDKDGKETGENAKTEQINNASALWKRNKSELKKADYEEFYKTLGHGGDEPLKYIHTHAEGTLEYTTLFYIPKQAPMDMYRVDYKPSVKLYVKRVFITDDDKELLPSYLRFVKGVIDSEDLPLNVSREILQQNKILANIKQASVKKILDMIAKIAKKEDEYAKFWKEFGRPIKEGIYSDYTNKDKLLDLARFKSTKQDGLTSLASYKENMAKDQKNIYYITGENELQLKNSPLLEAYKSQNIEVLILDDEADEIIIGTVNEYDKTPLKSVTHADAAKDINTEIDKEAEKKAEPIIKKITEALGDSVKEVRISARLKDSPSVVVADNDDQAAQMQQMMRAMGQATMGAEVKPILEINPSHQIVIKLSETDDKEQIEDISHLLLDQALLMDGKTIKDTSTFISRLNKTIQKAL